MELQTHLVQMVLQLLEDLAVDQEVLIQLHLEDQELVVKEILEDLVEIVQDVILHHLLVVAVELQQQGQMQMELVMVEQVELVLMLHHILVQHLNLFT